MASVKLTWRGLQELITALRAIPEELAAEAQREVIRAANETAAAIRDAYPIGPGDDEHEGGNLKKGVKVVEKNAGRWGAAAQVRSTARHARIFESGTQARHTALGYNRGPMPAANIFVPAMIRRRRELHGALIAIVERAGFSIRE